MRERWARYHKQWSDADGLAKLSEATREPLAAQRLGARPYSLSALQHYASCPYRFLLSAIYRLAPREDAIPLQRLDPLTKGSLFHRVQAEFLRTLRDENRLPIRPDNLDAALQTLGDTMTRVAEDERARLAPAIQRVWDDELAIMQRDLGRWTQMLAEDKDGWVPQWFEFAFGLSDDGGRDAASLPDPVLLDGRFVLRGSIDLVERHATGALRVTDHKTGRARWPERMIVAGGEVLQPVLYSLVLEAATKLARLRRPALVLHVRRRVQDHRRAADRDNAADRSRSAGNHRSRRGARRRWRRTRARAPAPGAISVPCAARTRNGGSVPNQRAAFPISTS